MLHCGEEQHLLKLYFSDGRSGIMHAADNTLSKPNYLPHTKTLGNAEITCLLWGLVEDERELPVVLQ